MYKNSRLFINAKGDRSKTAKKVFLNVKKRTPLCLYVSVMLANLFMIFEVSDFNNLLPLTV